MRIVLDAMGSDSYPDPEVTAAVEAVQRFGDEILLVGNEEILKPKLDALGSPAKVRVVHAPEVLEMTDKPASSARGKAENSMAIGMDLLKSGDGDAFVTAGNTGGAMANGLFRLGRIRGVKRPALTGVLPVQVATPYSWILALMRIVNRNTWSNLPLWVRFTPRIFGISKIPALV
jgi:glycerol-3-phosphate acyltransferase PlsX